MRAAAVLTAFIALGAGGGMGSLFGWDSDADTSTLQAVLEKGWEHVTAGSTVKLAHVKSGTRLTLPQVSYGTGSQQQAITAQGDASTTKGLWRIEVDDVALRGSPIACGSRLRLVNSDTDHSLHSHSAHKSPISGSQEVSGFDGRDNGDLWTVECIEKDARTWLRETPVHFKHVDTGKYLASLPNKKYRQPIVGHQEVNAGSQPDSNTQWMALEGYYFARRTPAASTTA
ncbi:hypothetical protein GGF46_004375 [Coemansia sp. RSA 552]|nr:hypothetical protein GGF46_004375 [Coemansia sp. RSA 552]